MNSRFLIPRLLLTLLVSVMAQAQVRWAPVGADLELAQIPVPISQFFSSELLLFRTTLHKTRCSVIKSAEFGEQRATVQELARRTGAVLALNANFFDEFGKPLGLILSRGIITQPLQRRGRTLTGVFQMSDTGPSIVSREEFTPHKVIEALQAGPRLLIAGKKVSGLDSHDNPSRRTGICIDAERRLILYSVSSRLFGLTLAQLQEALVAQAGCVDALNLDGGGSAQLYFSGSEPHQARSISIEGEDPVPVSIALFSTNTDNKSEGLSASPESLGETASH